MARTRNRTGTGQLLLLAALLLGIVTMHTLGHPAETASGHSPAHGSARSAASAEAAPVRGTDPGTRMAGPAHGSPHGMTHFGAGDESGGHGGMAMDPLSVCLAVLGAFTLVVLVRAGPWRPGGALARAPAAGRLRGPDRPEPPPPRALLSRLSVLRL
ncbi:DUF6153 family protein [Streptomyces flavofungini]|uniref:DUF6153 family protein n=1 Tax=Streptomyces flavofungini TaxID=68200 RepID=UPI0034DFE95F